MVHDRSLEFSVCLGGAKISRIQVINRSLTISLGFGLGNILKIFMLLTSTEQPVARTCKNLQSDLNIFKCLKCPPPVEMIIQSREVVQFRSILLHDETWGMPDKLLRP